jgi:penicillin-binding protein 1A
MAEKRQVFKNSAEREAYFRDKETRENLKKKKKKISRAKILFILFSSVFILILLTWYGFFIVSGLPPLKDLENPKFSLATRLYSYDGEILDQLCYQNRTMIPIDSIPKHLINALIAVEDHRFYDHWGVDVFRFIKARLKNFPFKMREGASTVTQQLARNLYLTMDITLTRKIREWITAVQIERTYTKDEILSLYLNIMYMGRGAYGVEAAAQAYFDKPVTKLTLSECAFLIGILKGPENYDPVDHPQRAIERRNLVLNQMLQMGFINEKTFQQTIQDSIITKEPSSLTGIAPHFSEMVRQQLQKSEKLKGYDIYRDGLRVYTTLDSRMQEAANRATEEHLFITQSEFNQTWKWNNRVQYLDECIKQEIYKHPTYKYAKSDNEKNRVYNRLWNSPKFVDSVKNELTTIQVGFVAIDPMNGYIKAMVGSSNYKKFRYGLNHVTQIRRQPGSSFKPFTYVTAIDNGYSPATTLLNEQVDIPDGTGKMWTPGNSDGNYGGKLSMRDGLRLSVNIISARIISELVTPSDVVKMAHQIGIESYIPEIYSISLGTVEVTPLEMTSAFGTFAAEGIHAEPIAIIRVEDRNGKLIYNNRPNVKEAISKETAYIMTNMMQDVVDRGTATSGVRAFFSYPAAGKTGTTQQMADAWFVGFTKQLVAGVWVGFDDHRVRFTSMTYGQGGKAAAPMWGRFMKYIYSDPRIRDLVPHPFLMPEGIERVSLCAETGKLATNLCTHTVEDFVLTNKKPPPCDGKHNGGVVQPKDEKPAIGF